MEIKFYNTSSANNVINKVLENETVFNIQLKDTTDVKTPMIIFRSEEPINFNYAYIDRFKRYYFVDRIELYPNKIYYIYLHCDVLETYKKDILKCEGNISQQKQNVNNYYDSGYKVEVRKEVDIYKSDVTLSDENTCNILVTIGG